MSDAKEIYVREYWSGDSKDGAHLNGDGYHFFRMLENGFILEAYELYETEDGSEVATPLPEMHKVGWIKDLGFDDLEELDPVSQADFERVKLLLEDEPTS